MQNRKIDYGTLVFSHSLHLLKGVAAASCRSFRQNGAASVGVENNNWKKSEVGLVSSQLLHVPCYNFVSRLMWLWFNYIFEKLKVLFGKAIIAEFDKNGIQIHPVGLGGTILDINYTAFNCCCVIINCSVQVTGNESLLPRSLSPTCNQLPLFLTSILRYFDHLSLCVRLTVLSKRYAHAGT